MKIGRNSILILAIAVSSPVAIGQERDKKRTSPALTKVPLTTVFSTNGQKGVRLVKLPVEDNDPNREEWKLFLRIWPTASNIFLVRGTQVRDAIKESLKLRSGGKGKVWLVVFFGFAERERIRWTIDSVELGQPLIRVNFRDSAPNGNEEKKEVSIPYFAWIPLEKLESGKFVLELVNSGSGEVVFSRRMELHAAP